MFNCFLSGNFNMLLFIVSTRWQYRRVPKLDFANWGSINFNKQKMFIYLIKNDSNIKKKLRTNKHDQMVKNKIKKQDSHSSLRGSVTSTQWIVSLNWSLFRIVRILSVFIVTTLTLIDWLIDRPHIVYARRPTYRGGGGTQLEFIDQLSWNQLLVLKFSILFSTITDNRGHLESDTRRPGPSVWGPRSTRKLLS